MHVDTQAGPLRILIIADDPLARTGLIGVLDALPESSVVGSAASQDDLVASFADLRRT